MLKGLDICTPPSSDGGPSCKGLVFRGYKNIFYSGGRLKVKQGVRLLKTRSCTGCCYCDLYQEDITEAICSNMPEIEHGALYSVRIVNVSTDWETGYADSWDTEIFKLPEA